MTERAAEISSRGRGINWNNKKEALAYRREYARVWRKTHRGKNRYKRTFKQLNSERAVTLEEVAVELGMSRERVRQIEKEALAKLRKALELRGLSFDALLPPTRGVSATQELMELGEPEAI